MTAREQSEQCVRKGATQAEASQEREQQFSHEKMLYVCVGLQKKEAEDRSVNMDTEDRAKHAIQILFCRILGFNLRKVRGLRIVSGSKIALILWVSKIYLSIVYLFETVTEKGEAGL